MSFAAFSVSELAYIEKQVLRQPYPEIKYPMIGVDTTAPEYCESIEFKTLDFRGSPAPFGGESKDVNMTEMMSTMGGVKVVTFAQGYDYTLQELMNKTGLERGAMINLLAEKAQGVRAIIEQFVDKLAFLGGQPSIPTGLLNDPVVPRTDAAKSIEDIVSQENQDDVCSDLIDLFRTAINRVYVLQTNTVFRPNTFALPVKQMEMLEGLRIKGTATPMMDYIKKELEIEMFSTLHCNGIGTGNKDRMMAITKHKDLLKMHLPQRFSLKQPASGNNIYFQSVGMLRTAGTEIRAPKSHLYIDGV